jgi:hypothetical protein
MLEILSLLTISLIPSETEWEIIRQFPSEQEMNKHGFVLINPLSMDMNRRYLYVLDQQEHGFHIFTHEGDYVQTVAGYGEGPGELSWPHHLSVTKHRVILVDQTQRIHYFDALGTFIERVDALQHYSRLIALEDALFTTTWSERSKYTFGLHDLKLQLKRGIPSQNDSRYNQASYDNAYSLARKGDRIFCLQQYGDNFRVFDLKGNRLHSGRLSFLPFEDPEYKSLKGKYAFPFFDIFDDHWVVYLIGRSGLRFFVFDMHGKLINRTKIPLMQMEGIEKNTLVIATDMIIRAEDSGSLLYLALASPEPVILKMFFPDDFWTQRQE